MKKKFSVINIAFLAIICAILVLGFVRTLVGAEDMLEYENRKAERIMPFSFASYLDGSFQDSVENALSDQVEGASAAKNGYNVVKSALLQLVTKPFNGYEDDEEDDNIGVIIDDNSDIGGSTETQTTEPAIVVEPVTSPAIVETPPAVTSGGGTEKADDDLNLKGDGEKPEVARGERTEGKYYGVGDGLYIFNDYVVQGVALFDANKPRFDKYISAYNNLIDTHPELNFYAYYIERDSDMNYASGYRNGIYEYISSQINVPEGHIKRQYIGNFEEYKEFNMKSDHHWSYKGSYAGYRDIMSMMKPGDNLREPLDELKIGYTKGSFTKTDQTANFKDDYYAYVFDLPEMEITSGGKPSALGKEAEFIEKARNGKDNQFLLYGDYFGGDMGEVVLYNPGGRGSLLMFGNSYDNAVIKLIASHYEYTYSIDLRYYKNVTKQDFSFEDYVSTHHIDDVLVMGNAYYYLQSPFIIKP